MGIVNMPVPFDGTDEEREANRNTHWWMFTEPGEPQRCGECDAKVTHVAASYPCGQNPPRMTVAVTPQSNL